MQLTKEKCDEIRVMKLLIDHHEGIANSLKTTLRTLIKDETGIDIDAGNYRLDLEKGTLDAVTTE